MGSLTLSVIVCTRNRAEHLKHCLRTLVAQRLAVDQYEIIVVDNHSTDETQTVADEFVRYHPHIRIVTEPRTGVSHARNTGVTHARAAYVAFIDDDARACPDWVANIIKAFQQTDPPPAVVGGPISPLYEQPPPDWFLARYETFNCGPTQRPLTSRWDCYGVCGANMAFEKPVISRFGGFRTDLGHLGDSIRLGEDTDLVLRVYAAGHPVWYDPAIRVQHWVPLVRMTLRYQCRRSYRGGVAVSRIEGTTVFSRKTRMAITSRFSQLMNISRPGQHVSQDIRDPASPAEISVPTSVPQSSALILILIAEKLGRYKGMSLW